MYRNMRVLHHNRVRYLNEKTEEDEGMLELIVRHTLSESPARRDLLCRKNSYLLRKGITFRARKRESQKGEGSLHCVLGASDTAAKQSHTVGESAMGISVGG